METVEFGTIFRMEINDVGNIVTQEIDLLANLMHKNNEISFNSIKAEMLQSAEDFSSSPNSEAHAFHAKPLIPPEENEENVKKVEKSMEILPNAEQKSQKTINS